MYIPTWVFPKDIKYEYNINALSENGKVLAEIITGMYEAGILAYRKLVQHLKDADSSPPNSLQASSNTPPDLSRSAW